MGEGCGSAGGGGVGEGCVVQSRAELRTNNSEGCICI